MPLPETYARYAKFSSFTKVFIRLKEENAITKSIPTAKESGVDDAMSG